MNSRPCKVDGCVRERHGAIYCAMHEQRVKKKGDPGPAHPIRAIISPEDICTIDGCEGPVLAREWCSMHYKRWQKAGVLGTAEPRRFSGGRVFRCSVEGCEIEGSNYPVLARELRLPIMKSGMCGPHDHAAKRYGDPSLARSSTAGEYHYRWQGDNVSYTGAHARIVKERGRAKQYSCVICGKRARDWSYNGLDLQSELYGPRKSGEGHSAYSPCPEFYDPLCRKCHLIKDHAKNRADLYTFRLWWVGCGFTLSNLDLIHSMKPGVIN